MPEFTKRQFINRITERRILPTFHNDDLDISKKIVNACLEGGADIVEFTNRGGNAYQIFSELAKWRNEEHPELMLGTGTITDSSTASLYINSGADFVVGPVSNKKVAEVCNRRKVTYVPGCFTPSEISNGQEMGADLIKVFPASVLGPSFIGSVKGPLTEAKLMPSGGVRISEDNLEGWFEAGADAVNVGSDLIKKDLVKNRDFDGISERVEKGLSIIENLKESE